MKQFTQILTSSLIVAFMATVSSATQAANKPVAISKGMASVSIIHKGAVVELMREQDNDSLITQEFGKTSRPCPPFCIQPMIYAPGVETLGELEVIDYLVRMDAGENILVIDSRTPKWVKKGTIPGAVNVPFTSLAPNQGASTEGIMDIMLNQMGVTLIGDIDEFEVDEAIVGGTVSHVFDYSKAKTLVLFCNGMWCGQSPASMETLLRFGYPASKIKWFRGGMQTWQILGLTTI